MTKLMTIVGSNRLTMTELEADYSCTSNIVRTEEPIVIKMAHLIDFLYPGSESLQKNTDGLVTSKQDVSRSLNTMYKLISDSVYMKTLGLG